MSADFSKTRDLFSALCRVESTSDIYVRELGKLQARLAREPRPRDFSYVPPPEEDDDEESKQLDEQIRSEIPGYYKSWVRDFDDYHGLERRLRQAIEKAKLAAGDAGVEIDGQNPQSPLDRKSAQVRLALQDLGGVVPPPFIVGFYPPSSPDVLRMVAEQRAVVASWINRLRVLFHPAPLPVAHEGGASSGGSQVEHSRGVASSTTDPSTSGAEQPLSEDAGPKQPTWLGSDDGSAPLRGWAAICDEIKCPKGKNRQRGLRRLNKRTGGPIKWMGNRPEVNRGVLLAWIRDTEGRSRLVEERQASREGTAKELAERHGARQKDLGFHKERRPNARGKARPAPEGP